MKRFMFALLLTLSSLIHAEESEVLFQDVWKASIYCGFPIGMYFTHINVLVISDDEIFKGYFLVTDNFKIYEPHEIIENGYPMPLDMMKKIFPNYK